MEKIILTTPIEHIPTCIKSGAQACKDYIHTKQNWTRNDLDLMAQIISNYLPNERIQKNINR